MTKEEALAIDGAELSLSGRCVGRLEYTELGTTFHIFWHAPEGCEHVAPAPTFKALVIPV